MWKLAPVLIALAAPIARAEAAKPFADVEIKLDDAKLAAKGAGVHTLFITIYDAASQAPRPYGAVKVDLAKDASKGTIYKGTLDQNNVMVMGGGEMPKKLRIKAKLDKDGSAGPDEAGDLVGTTETELGGKAVVTIDKAI
jgi:hypothetical protein